MKILNASSFKKGFTLAEMLIVLAVIGIVAAIMIASVAASSQKTRLISALQKANNVFVNVANRSQAEGDMMDTWNYSLDVGEFANRYFTPRFNIIKNCGTTEEGCFADAYVRNDGSDATSSTTGGDFYKFVVSDGTSIGIKLETEGDQACTATNPSICARLVVDVNGLSGPNKWGKDVFEFQILGNLNTIVPAGSFSSYDSETNRWTFNEQEAINTNCKTTGEYCAAKIVNDGWEIKY